METERSQAPEMHQQTRKPSAVIIKGNPDYITGNKDATKFYNDLADFIRSKDFSVTFDKGKDHTMPTKADLWIGHSRGASRCRFAPEDQKTVMLGAPGGVNHPLDISMSKWETPNLFHYMITNEMKKAISNAMEKKADFFNEIDPRLLGSLAGGGLGASIGALTANKGKRLSQGLIGGGLGAAGGFLGGMSMNDKFKPLDLTEEYKQQGIQNTFLDKVRHDGFTTPREVDQMKFNDLDSRIEQARQYRSQHPNINYLQDLTKFDRKAPVHFDAPAVHEDAGDASGYTKSLNLGDLNAAKAEEMKKYDLTHSNGIFDKLLGVRSRFENLLDFSLNEARNKIHGHVFINNNMTQDTPISKNLNGIEVTSAGDGKESTYDVLEHEVKGHIPQIDNMTKHDVNPAQQIIDTKDPRLNYYAEQAELERRIQATKDYATQVSGHRPTTPEEFKSILQKLPNDPARQSDVYDLQNLIKKTNDTDKKNKLIEYISKLSPGIVKNEQMDRFKTASVYGALSIAELRAFL